MVKLEITYDPTYFQAGASAFTPNTAIFPKTLEGPIYSAGKVAVALSVGSDPTKAIQTTAILGTLTLTALGNVTNSPVSFAVNTKAYSLGSSDASSENVILSTDPSLITIGQGGPDSSSLTTTQVLPTSTPRAYCLGCPPPTTTPAPTSVVRPTSTPTPPAGRYYQYRACAMNCIAGQGCAPCPPEALICPNGTPTPKPVFFSQSVTSLVSVNGQTHT